MMLHFEVMPLWIAFGLAGIVLAGLLVWGLRFWQAELARREGRFKRSRGHAERWYWSNVWMKSRQRRLPYLPRKDENGN
jgi:hypothetical protein